ncbi:MAG: sorbosone dehydrogenase family protein [Steroidobacteraceae bacterium]
MGSLTGKVETMTRWLLLFVLSVSPWATGWASSESDRVLANVRLPPGFKMELYTDRVPKARSMTLGRQGTVFVGTREEGVVYAVSSRSGAAAPEVRIIARDLNQPNGVAYRDGALYVAEINRILRFDQIESSSKTLEPKVVRDDLPKDRHHGWRYIAFGPDGKLYLAIGAPCNICNEPNYAVIQRMNPDGSDREVVAHGVRNSVGFTWHPTTRELWFTDNGRDWLGDDAPPCELNRAPRAGLHFGFPFCHGADIKDPEFGKMGECSQSEPPVRALDAHVAPLGLKFYLGRNFPSQYQGQLFIAEHGSWNRSVKSGYRITRVKLEGEKVVSYVPFAVGFHRGDEVFGRPVDLLELEDGSLLISDDRAGAIYRVSYVISP